MKAFFILFLSVALSLCWQHNVLANPTKNCDGIDISSRILDFSLHHEKGVDAILDENNIEVALLLFKNDQIVVVGAKEKQLCFSGVNFPKMAIFASKTHFFEFNTNQDLVVSSEEQLDFYADSSSFSDLVLNAQSDLKIEGRLPLSGNLILDNGQTLLNQANIEAKKVSIHSRNIHNKKEGSIIAETLSIDGFYQLKNEGLFDLSSIMSMSGQNFFHHIGGRILVKNLLQMNVDNYEDNGFTAVPGICYFSNKKTSVNQGTLYCHTFFISNLQSLSLGPNSMLFGTGLRIFAGQKIDLNGYIAQDKMSGQQKYLNEKKLKNLSPIQFPTKDLEKLYKTIIGIQVLSEKGTINKSASCNVKGSDQILYSAPNMVLKGVSKTSLFNPNDIIINANDKLVVKGLIDSSHDVKVNGPLHLYGEIKSLEQVKQVGSQLDITMGGSVFADSFKAVDDYVTIKGTLNTSNKTSLLASEMIDFSGNGQSKNIFLESKNVLVSGDLLAQDHLDIKSGKNFVLGETGALEASKVQTVADKDQHIGGSIKGEYISVKSKDGDIYFHPKSSLEQTSTKDQAELVAPMGAISLQGNVTVPFLDLEASKVAILPGANFDNTGKIHVVGQELIVEKDALLNPSSVEVRTSENAVVKGDINVTEKAILAPEKKLTIEGDVKGHSLQLESNKIDVTKKANVSGYDVEYKGKDITMDGHSSAYNQSYRGDNIAINGTSKAVHNHYIATEQIDMNGLSLGGEQEYRAKNITVSGASIGGLQNFAGAEVKIPGVAASLEQNFVGEHVQVSGLALAGGQTATAVKVEVNGAMIAGAQAATGAKVDVSGLMLAGVQSLAGVSVNVSGAAIAGGQIIAGVPVPPTLEQAKKMANTAVSGGMGVPVLLHDVASVVSGVPGALPKMATDIAQITSGKEIPHAGLISKAATLAYDYVPEPMKEKVDSTLTIENSAIKTVAHSILTAEQLGPQITKGVLNKTFGEDSVVSHLIMHTTEAISGAGVHNSGFIASGQQAFYGDVSQKGTAVALKQGFHGSKVDFDPNSVTKGGQITVDSVDADVAGSFSANELELNSKNTHLKNAKIDLSKVDQVNMKGQAFKSEAGTNLLVNNLSAHFEEKAQLSGTITGTGDKLNFNAKNLSSDAKIHSENGENKLLGENVVLNGELLGKKNYVEASLEMTLGDDSKFISKESTTVSSKGKALMAGSAEGKEFNLDASHIDFSTTAPIDFSKVEKMNIGGGDLNLSKDAVVLTQDVDAKISGPVSLMGTMSGHGHEFSMKGQEVIVGGTLDYSNPKLMADKAVTTLDSSTISGDKKISFIAPNVSISGKMIASTLDFSGSDKIKLEEGFDGTETMTTLATNKAEMVVAPNVHYTTVMDTDLSKLQVYGTLNIADASHMQCPQIDVLEGAHCNFLKDDKVKASLVTIEKDASIGAPKGLELTSDKVKLEGTVIGKRFSFFTKNLEESETGKIIAVEKIQFGEDGDEKIELNGEVDSFEMAIKSASLHQGKRSKISFDKAAEIVSKDLNLEGEFHSTYGQLTLNGEDGRVAGLLAVPVVNADIPILHITKDAKIKSRLTSIEATTDFKTEGEISGIEQVFIKVGDDYIPAGIVSSEGKVALSGSYSEEQCRKFAQGGYSNIKANNYSITTDKRLVFEKDLCTDKSAEIYASRLKLLGDVKSRNGNLKLGTTKGDLIFGDKNVEALNGNIELSSARDLKLAGTQVKGQAIALYVERDLIQKYVGSKDSYNPSQIMAQGRGTKMLMPVVQRDASGSPLKDQFGNYIYKEEEVDVGIYMRVGGKYKNVASVLDSEGAIVVDADKGMEFSPYTYTKDWSRTKKTWLGARKKTEYHVDAYCKNAQIKSKDKNFLFSKDGDIHFVATDFMAKAGTQMQAKSGVTGEDVVCKDQVTTTKTFKIFVPLHKAKKFDEKSFSVVSSIIDSKKIAIDTSGKVYLRGVVTMTSGNVAMNGDDGVTVDRSILTHREDSYSKGFQLSAPALEAISKVARGESIYNALKQVDPMLSQAGLAYESGMDGEQLAMLANTGSLGVQGYNQYGQLLSGAQSLKDFGMAQAMQATKAGIKYKETESHATTQTLGGGGIYSQSLDISSKKDVLFDNAVDINVKNNARIKADHFIQKGVALHDSSSESERDIAVSVNALKPTGVDIDFSMAKNSMQRTTYVNQQFNVGGNLEVVANEWVLDAANTDASTLSGEAKKVEAITRVSTIDTKSQQMSIGATISPTGVPTGARGSFGKNSGHMEYVNQASGIKIHNKNDGSNPEIGGPFKTEQITLNGAMLETPDEKYTDNIVTTDINTKSHSSGFNVGGGIGASEGGVSFSPSLGFNQGPNREEVFKGSAFFGEQGKDEKHAENMATFHQITKDEAGVNVNVTLPTLEIPLPAKAPEIVNPTIIAREDDQKDQSDSQIKVQPKKDDGEENSKKMASDPVSKKQKKDHETQKISDINQEFYVDRENYVLADGKEFSNYPENDKKLGSIPVVPGLLSSNKSGEEKSNTLLDKSADLLSYGSEEFCFVKDTYVETVDGKVAIQKLKSGDLVPTCKMSSSADECSLTDIKKIKRVNHRFVDEVLRLTLSDGNILTSTLDHPYFMYADISSDHPEDVENLNLWNKFFNQWSQSEKREFIQESLAQKVAKNAKSLWVMAKDLQEGDVLLSDDAELVRVDAVERIPSYTEVFNIQVQDNHNYYVSCEDGLLDKSDEYRQDEHHRHPHNILVHNCKLQKVPFVDKVAPLVPGVGSVYTGLQNAQTILSSTDCDGNPISVENKAVAGASLLFDVLPAGSIVQKVVSYANKANNIKKTAERIQKKMEGETKPPSRPSKMQQEVKRGQAPRDVERVDKGHIPGQEPHVHYTDGTSSNQSGGIHDAHKGQPNPSKKTAEWLKEHGWETPQ